MPGALLPAVCPPCRTPRYAAPPANVLRDLGTAPSCAKMGAAAGRGVRCRGGSPGSTNRSTATWSKCPRAGRRCAWRLPRWNALSTSRASRRS